MLWYIPVFLSGSVYYPTLNKDLITEIAGKYNTLSFCSNSSQAMSFFPKGKKWKLSVKMYFDLHKTILQSTAMINAKLHGRDQHSIRKRKV